MNRSAQIYNNISEGDHFYDPKNDRHLTVYSIYKNDQTALCTVEEYEEDELVERYNQLFTFRELAHMEGC